MTLSTRSKLKIARLLYMLTRMVFGGKKRIIQRGGLKFEIDISEGIDLSLLWFGNFQRHVSENKFVIIPEDAVIFDVGANAGVMSLNFAKNAPKGKVYAFEPTNYALKKLRRNLELNPGHSSVVEPINAFLSSTEKKREEIRAYSSWKVDKSIGHMQHQVHGGTAMSTVGVPTITLDEFIQRNKIDRIDFIKIDTDGHEYDVLMGAEKSIRQFQPQIIFELGLYVMEERNIQFSNYLEYFSNLGYSLSNAANNRHIDENNYLKMIPKNGTIDVLALPKG